MIRDIQMEPGVMVQDVLTVVRSKVLYHEGHAATEVLRLGDATGSIGAIITDESTLCQRLWLPGTRLQVTGDIRAWEGRMIIELHRAEMVHDEHDLSLIPSDWLAGTERREFEDLIMELKTEPLRRFLMRVFADNSIAERFFRIGASQNHHHQERGGLLQHSLECALSVRESAKGCLVEREMGVVAALLHDIGKIWTLNEASTRTELGRLVPHYQLTLEMLAPHLRWLQLGESELCHGIRYLLTQGQVAAASKNQYPVMPVATLIRSADRYSAAQDVERRAYANQSHRYATYATGSGPENRFWRAAM